MKAYADEFEKDAKYDCSTMFVSRALRWCGSSGAVAMVLLNNCSSLQAIRSCRGRLLKKSRGPQWRDLDPVAFQEITGEVFRPRSSRYLRPAVRLDENVRHRRLHSEARGNCGGGKGRELRGDPVSLMLQAEQLKNPMHELSSDGRVVSS